MKNKENKKKKKIELKVKRTVQDTLDFIGIDGEEGVIQISDKKFTKSYLLSDINYQIAKEDEQESLFLEYSKLLNYFDSSMKFQITINNKPLNEEEIKKSILLPMVGDKNDEYREDYNKNILLKKLSEGKNNIQQEKYLTIQIEAESMDEAIKRFRGIDNDIISLCNNIGRSKATPVSSTDRVEVLYDFFNPETKMDKKYDDKLLNGKLDFDNLRKQGMSVKDLIAPASLEFEKDHFKIGDKYAQVIFMKSLGSALADTFLSQLNGCGLEMMCSLNYEPVDREEAVKAVKRQLVNINEEITKRQSKAAQSGTIAYITPEQEAADAEGRALLEDITLKGQNMFMLTLCIVHTAVDLDDLRKNRDVLIKIAKISGVDLKVLTMQQERGLTSTLPLCNNQIKIKRTLTTESSAVFMPYNAVECLQKGGSYYGVNSISSNLILLDRNTLQNQNGFILGTPGAGKSFAAKMEMISVILNHPKARVSVIDPEGEFRVLANALGGKIVKITPSGSIHINPLDLDSKYSDKDDPLTMKLDFMLSLIATCWGEDYTLTPFHKAIIERALRQTYATYLKSYNRETDSYDKSLTPVFDDFRKTLLAQKEPEAKDIALAIEMYTQGVFNAFSSQTNIGELNEHFVVYDIKDMGNTIKSLALQIILDNIWQNMIANKLKGLRSYLYIDEAHILFANNFAARYLQEVYKRSRKWGASCTCISQNVADILRNEYAETILANSSMIIMLNQAPTDKVILASMLNISETQLNYITNAPAGSGLIYTTNCLIPFKNNIGTDTKLYKLMTTKPNETNELYDKV